MSTWKWRKVPRTRSYEGRHKDGYKAVAFVTHGDDGYSVRVFDKGRAGRVLALVGPFSGIDAAKRAMETWQIDQHQTARGGMPAPGGRGEAR